MKIKSVLCLFLICTAIVSTVVWAQNLHGRLESSRQIVKKFADQLKSRLEQAIHDSGPSGAITVCAEVAPVIASDLSQKNQCWVGRTSLKFRNSANAPDKWETRALKAFEKRKADGEPVQKLECYEVVEADGKKQFRYMKAISTKPVCLVCHGENISAETAGVLNSYYPEDNARNFKVGDIRGAFTIIQTLKN